MCLAMPSKVVEVLEDEMAIVELGGVKKTISLGLLEDIRAEDYVIVHVGYALSKVDEAEALRTIELLEQMGEISGGEAAQ